MGRFFHEVIYDYLEGCPSCHASTIAELPSGGLVAAWYAGTREGHPDVAVFGARKPRDAGEWTEPQVLADTPGKSEGNPVLFVADDGEVWLFFVTQEEPGWVNCRIKHRKSADEGATWGEVQIWREERGWMPRNKLVALRNGDVLFPLYDERAGQSVFSYSCDGGRTWHNTAPLPSDSGNIQPSVVQLADGSLLALMRDVGHELLWMARSPDNGRTWTRPERTSLRNPNSAADVVRLHNGHLALAFNDSSTRRTPLTIALSEDEGRTWPIRRNLETGEDEFSYPAIIQTRDGLMHVTYTYRRTHIKHVVLDEEWVRAGAASH
ncbi:MAG: exo-alpha-sialidase [Armatimonadota bacterium]